MTNTEKTIRAIAEKHNIPVTKALEITNLYAELLEHTIADPCKENNEGLLDIDKFKIVSIQNFGKFVPKASLIKMTNTKRLKQKQQHES